LSPHHKEEEKRKKIKMNGIRYLFLLNCALMFSLINSATAQQKYLIGNGVTPPFNKKRALQFGILESILNSILSNVRLELPDFTLSENIPLVGPIGVPVEFSASNIACYDVNVDNVDVSIDPTGFLAADFNINAAVKLECQMDYSLQGGLLLSDQGSVTLVSQENSVDLVASFSPTSLSFSRCSFNPGTSELDFSGSAASEILNAFEDIIVGVIDGALGNLDICGDFGSILVMEQDQLMPVFEEMLAERNGGGRALLLQKAAIDDNDSMRQNLRTRKLS